MQVSDALNRFHNGKRVRRVRLTNRAAPGRLTEAQLVSRQRTDRRGV
jgi:hypothetical protein